ncbi:MAG: A/G-specific adenine glycosylase [Bacteroidales bacterium]
MHPYMSLTEKIISWYSQNKRDLPWRETSDPFKIWLSEVIMQQTRIEQGTSYYLKFVNEFASIEGLANAPEEKIMRMWQGLGYYSRARNLHAAAKQVTTQYGGLFPVSYRELIKLKGIGDYTAAAISSIASKEKVPAVDGNVKRVIARFFDIRQDIAAAKTYTTIKNTCAQLMGDEDPGTFNQALMDFGALICTPRNPQCHNCPLREHCLAVQSGMVKELPVKYNRTKKKNRFFNFLVLEFENDQQAFFYIVQRKEKDIWNRLFQFPLIESKELLEEKVLLNELKTLIPDINTGRISFSTQYKHLLSHQIIFAQFIRIRLKNEPKKIPAEWLKIPQEKITDYGIPRLIDQYLKTEYF